MTLTLALASSASNCTVHFTVQLTKPCIFSVLLLLLLSSVTATSPVEAGDLKFPIPGQYTGSSSSSFMSQVTSGDSIGFSWQKVLGLAVVCNKLLPCNVWPPMSSG